MADALSRQRERRAAQLTRKNERRKPVSPKHERLAFKTAKQHFSEIKKATEAQFHLGPVAVQLVMAQLIAMLGAYRSRGKGRGTPSRGYGNRCNNAGRMGPHQGLQERLRRVRGGWAQSIRMSGFTKNAALDEVNKHRRDIAAHTLLTGERLAV